MQEATPKLDPATHEPPSSNGRSSPRSWLPKRFKVQKVSIPKLESQLSLIFSILLKAVLFLLLFGLSLLIYKGLNRDGYTLKEIEVPTTFSAGGYSGTVLAHQIQDRLEKIRNTSSTLRKDSLQFSSNESPEMNVAVMGFGISLQSVVYYARDILGKENKSIGGELTELDSMLTFHLRMTGISPKSFSESLKELNRSDALESLLEEVSSHIMKQIDPQTLALYQTKKGKYEPALETVRFIINKQNKELDWAYWTWGYVLYSQRNYSEAEPKLKKALEINDEREHYWTSYGGILRLQGKDKEAQEVYERATQRLADKDNLWHNLAWTYVVNRKYEKGEIALSKAIDLDPEVYYYYSNLGEILMQKMNYYKGNHPDTNFTAVDTQAVIQNFQKAYALNKENSSGAMSLYSAYRFAKKEDSARMMVDLAVELDPYNGWAWQSKLSQAFTDSAYEEAVKVGKKGLRAFKEIRKNSNSSDHLYREMNILNYMAMASYMIQEYDSAFQYVHQAIEKDPNIAYPYTTLAETYGLSGNREKFYENLEKALELGFDMRNLIKEIPYVDFAEEKRFKRLKKKYLDTPATPENVDP